MSQCGDRILHDLLDFLAPRSHAELIIIPSRGSANEVRRQWLLAEQHRIMNTLSESTRRQELISAIGRKIENNARAGPVIASLRSDSAARREIGQHLLRLQVILRYLYSINLAEDNTIKYETWPHTPVHTPVYTP